MSIPLERQISEVLLKLQGYSVESLSEVERRGRQQIHIRLNSLYPPRCKVCGREVPIYDTHDRHIHHASIFCYAIILVVKMRRTNCPCCGIKTEFQSIAEGKKRHSKHLESCVLQYTCKMDNKSTAKLLGYSVSSIYRIDKAGLEKLELKLHSKTPKMEHVSIDETAYKKRHHYATVLTNQDDSRVVDLCRGKSKQSAMSLFNKYSDKLDWLETVAMDFSQSYISATIECFAAHYIVFDKFHFSQYVNRCLEQVRRMIQRALPDDLRYQSKKYSRWLVLRRATNMNQTHLDRLQQLKSDNADLFDAYLLKEELLSIFDVDVSKDTARKLLLEWCEMAYSTKFYPFHRLAKSIRSKLDLLLNWFVKHLTNAKAEAVNNVIKVLIRRGYGYKDFEYFRLKVLQSCGYLMNEPTHTN